MLDEHLFLQQQHNKKRFDAREVFGWMVCGVAVTYLLTAAVLGLLAR